LTFYESKNVKHCATYEKPYRNSHHLEVGVERKIALAEDFGLLSFSWPSRPRWKMPHSMQLPLLIFDASAKVVKRPAIP